MVLQILRVKVKVKVALIVMAWMFLEKIRSRKTVLRRMVIVDVIVELLCSFLFHFHEERWVGARGHLPSPCSSEFVLCIYCLFVGYMENLLHLPA